MFIFNLKIDKKKLSKLVILITIILALVVTGFAIYKIFFGSTKSEPSYSAQSTQEIQAINYTNFLKDCHENIDSYVGKSFTLIGYVYRMPDFNDNQFVLSRTMIISEANSAVVVGILSECKDACNFADGDWVRVCGTIVKGNYKGEMPVLEIQDINKCNKPEDEYVYPPSGQWSI